MNMITSLLVTEMINDDHKSTLRSIRVIKSKIDKNLFDLHFNLTSYKDKKGEERPYYNLSMQGLKMYLDTKRNSTKLEPLWNYYNAHSEEETTVILTSRFEENFGKALQEYCDAMDWTLESQKPCLGYRIDFYIKDMNLAIEYDEKQHNYTREQDVKRENEIINKLYCGFIRLDYNKSDAYNLGLISKSVIYDLRFIP